MVIKVHAARFQYETLDIDQLQQTSHARKDFASVYSTYIRLAWGECG